jgi:hypothetical protein
MQIEGGGQTNSIWIRLYSNAISNRYRVPTGLSRVLTAPKVSQANILRLIRATDKLLKEAAPKATDPRQAIYYSGRRRKEAHHDRRSPYTNRYLGGSSEDIHNMNDEFSPLSIRGKGL